MRKHYHKHPWSPAPLLTPPHIGRMTYLAGLVQILHCVELNFQTVQAENGSICSLSWSSVDAVKTSSQEDFPRAKQGKERCIPIWVHALTYTFHSYTLASVSDRMILPFPLLDSFHLIFQPIWNVDEEESVVYQVRNKVVIKETEGEKSKATPNYI